MGCSKSSFQWEIYSNTILPQEPRKIKNPQTNLTPKATKEEQQQRQQQQQKTKVSRRKEIIKIRAEINEIVMKKSIEKINETKNWLFEKINKIDNPFAKLISKRRERAGVNKIKNEKGEVTTDTTGIPTIIRDYCKPLYAKKMDSLEEMDKFLEKYNKTRMKWEEIENMNIPITNNEIETVIANISTNKSPGPDGYTGESYQTFREELSFSNISEKLQREEHSQPHSMRPQLL